MLSSVDMLGSRLRSVGSFSALVPAAQRSCPLYCGSQSLAVAASASLGRHTRVSTRRRRKVSTERFKGYRETPNWGPVTCVASSGRLCTLRAERLRSRRLSPRVSAAGITDPPLVESGGADTSTSVVADASVELEESFTISAALPDALAVSFPDRFPTMTSARKACRRRQVFVLREGEWQRGVCIDQVAEGQGVRVLHRAATLSSTRRSHRLQPVYEDDHMAVVMKLPGMMVHGRGRKTVKHVLGGSLQPSSAPGALPRPHPVHRLDKLTGGLLVCAKTAPAAVTLNRMFEERQVQKKYVALVAGLLEGEGHIEEEVDGKEASSRYQVVESFRSLRFTGHMTLLHLWPHTGRKHQLRKHLASIGHPIIGDGLYCDQEDEELSLRHQGLFLWAVELSLRHPVTGEPLELQTELPPKFLRFTGAQQKRWEKFHQP